MKPRCSNQGNQAFALTELLVVIAVVVFLGVCLLSVLRAAHHGDKAINCLNNLHQIGVAHQLWVGDLNNQFSLLTFAADNHAGKLTRNDSAYILWQAMSNQLNTPKILVCPADKKRTVAAGFATGFGNANVSYFLNAAAKTDPQAVFDGDANLIVDGLPVQSGILNLWTNNRVGWTKERNHGMGSGGYIGMADGSVQGVTSNMLNAVFAVSPATNRLAIP
jgi:type II secretory pathway pseudopilin PulG